MKNTTQFVAIVFWQTLLLMRPAVSHLFGIYKSVAIVGPLLVHLLVLQEKLFYVE